MVANPGKDGYIAATVVDPSMSATTAIFPRRGSGDAPENSNMHCLIGKEDAPAYKCYPYRLSRFRYFLMIVIYLLTAGFMWLMFYWRPDWKLKFTHYRSSFEKADSVFLEAQDGTQRVFVSEIQYDDPSVKTWASHIFSRNFYSDTGVYHENVKFRGYQNKNVRDSSGSSLGSVSDEEDPVKYFFHELYKFMWDAELQTFVKVEGYDGNVTFQFVHNCANTAIPEQHQKEMLKLYGENVIHVEVPSYIRLLIVEVLNPFYVFQVAACTFWMVDEYYAYAVAILIISFISAVISLITIRRERQSLHDMVERHNTARVTVAREIKTKECVDRPSSSNGVASTKEYVTEEIWIKDLVPGDIVVIPPSGIHLSFDAALISGTCIVNESMLTGESVPVTKTPLACDDSEMGNTYRVDLQKSHTLFCGTEIIQTRYYQDEVVRAVVVRTGFGTAKGRLVHSILFPKPVNLRLLRDAYRFVGVMCCIAVIGFAYSTYLQITFEESLHDIFFKSIDIITITVPPALPLAMTIGIIYAQDRLKKVHIHTISPQRINICGQVDVVAFDKTGTLTEDGLDLTDIVPVSSNKFASPLLPKDLMLIEKTSELLRCMATCHSLTLIENEVSGDPLDVKMLEATGWELVEPKVDDGSKYDQLQTTYVRPPTNAFSESDVTLSTELDNQSLLGQSGVVTSKSDNEIGIIRQFPFLSSLQRASVVTKPLHSEPTDMVIYTKGAPEKIASLCLSVPHDFHSILKIYTRQGHRVIALAYKKINLKWLKAQKIARDEVEKDLNFLGFLILQNKLKPSSANVIRNLDSALIRKVMVTGDNLETAICVAKECKILKPNIPVLVATCDVSGDYPILTWRYTEDGTGADGTKKLSSSEDTGMSDAIICMGDSNAPFECQLAMTGVEFSMIREYFPRFIPALAVQGAVFARMSPQNKTELMEELEGVDYHTLMCGDGANDCGALKRAHVGLSLSEYDASVAAPFTARTENGIDSVITLVREGRAALVTSFGMFKFMALYSMIQFTTVILLYQNETNFADYQFLYIDLIIIDIVAITMSRNHAYKTLHWRKPPVSLVCVEMLICLFLQIFLQFGFQILSILLVQGQCWFAKPIFVNETGHVISDDLPADVTMMTVTNVVTNTPNFTSCPALANAEQIYVTDDNYQRTYETTVLVYVSSFMYLAISVSFSQGKPFRTAIYKNRFFLLSLLILSAFNLFMMFGAPPEFDVFMDLWRIPDLSFMFILCAIILGHFIVSLCIEIFFIENPALWNLIKTKCACRKTAHRKRYKHLQCVFRGETIPKRAPRSYGSDSHKLLDSEIMMPSQFVTQPIYSKIPYKNFKVDNYGTRL